MLQKHTHLWECKVNEETSLYEHTNECIESNTLNTNDEMRNPILSYDVLILEDNFHNVWFECNGYLYWPPIDLLWAVMPSIWKDGGLRNSHKMRLSGIPVMFLLISPSIQTYIANIDIWRGSIY